MKEKGSRGRGRPKKEQTKTKVKTEVKEQVKEEVKTEVKQKRQYIENKVVIDNGIICPHCKHRYGHKATNVYPNGNTRVLCGLCQMPFVIRKIQDK